LISTRHASLQKASSSVMGLIMKIRLVLWFKQ
jgi:hypothetical protein